MVVDGLVEEEPLGNGHNTVLRLIQRGELCFHGIIGIVRHLKNTIQEKQRSKGYYPAQML